MKNQSFKQSFILSRTIGRTL